MTKLRVLAFLLLLAAIYRLNAYTFGQNKVNRQPERWATVETMHFDIYFPAGEDEFGKLAALMAEETYYKLREHLKLPAGSRIPVIFYSSKTAFQNTNIIYPLLSEGIGGFTESLRNRVVIPFDGSYRELETLLAHELTHAYVNALDKGYTGAFNALRPASFPFWFSEGLPEFLSLGGSNDYSNMFMLDMVVNDYQLKLGQSEDYYAYRMGESFLAYIAATYGRQKVADYFFAIRSAHSLDAATRKVFGLDFEDLESRWKYQLKRDYYPLVNSHGIPMEDLEQRTESDKDGSYFNFMPRFSPNGERFVYFSSAGARYSVWMAGLHGLAKPDRIFTGEANGQAEEFYYFRSNLSWFPDNRRIAFSAKTSQGDRIQILDVEREKIVQSLDLPEFDAIYEVDVAPDGGSVAFAGQKGVQCDLYLYDLATGGVKQLTNDLFNDAQPRFSPDGRSIVFSSERHRSEASARQGFFANLVNAVFSLDLEGGALRQHTFGDVDCSFPMYDGTGTKILYLTYTSGVNNFRAIDLATGREAEVTDILSGVFAGDISRDNRYLLVSNYFNRAWNIYFANSPLDSLSYAPGPGAQPYAETGLLQGIDLSRLDYYGKRDRPRLPRENPAGFYDARDPLFGEASPFSYTREDSLYLSRDYSWDDPPQTTENPPRVEPYRTTFALDSVWGGLAYSSSVGTVGNIELSLSDLMGNHGIGISAGIAGKLKDSNLLVTYLLLKHRTDYGIGAFNLVDEVFYRDPVPSPDDYYRYRERQTGLYFMLRYPFSRFFRVETDHKLYQRGQYWSKWQWDDAAGQSGHWGEDDSQGQDLVYTPGLGLVHDNALYGSTGPLVGWRGLYNVYTTLSDGKVDYVTNYLDLRSYTLFSKRYALALRAIAGVSGGRYPQRFDLNGYYGVRAVEEEISGTKKALASAELRFPFFDYIAMAFPLPIAIPNIRGSLFADLGTVFDDYESFRGTRDGRLKDLRLGYGFGPRLNLGYVVLSLDVAWRTDLSRISRPYYYLSLNEDF